MKFTKMHGAGNDYIYVNCIDYDLENPSGIAKLVSDRHFGIGSDGLVLILPSEKADFRMRMFNSDGSEAEMCGNAIRCVGKYVYDNGLINKKTVSIETLAGIKVLDLAVKENEVVLVKVDMGEPVLEAEKIPVISNKRFFVSEPVTIDGQTYKVTCVSMGNP
ncbi:MAG TPA: diaminopimelate epimerase, partial [Thermoanaerobacterales bacterium]|nr:diaminopimelate epimerase [Thermoanaerobacterales bacterium]